MAYGSHLGSVSLLPVRNFLLLKTFQGALKAPGAALRCVPCPSTICDHMALICARARPGPRVKLRTLRSTVSFRVTDIGRAIAACPTASACRHRRTSMASRAADPSCPTTAGSVDRENFLVFFSTLRDELRESFHNSVARVQSSQRKHLSRMCGVRSRRTTCSSSTCAVSAAHLRLVNRKCFIFRDS